MFLLFIAWGKLPTYDFMSTYDFFSYVVTKFSYVVTKQKSYIKNEEIVYKNRM